jgi:hypothetical protein
MEGSSNAKDHAKQRGEAIGEPLPPHIHYLASPTPETWDPGEINGCLFLNVSWAGRWAFLHDVTNWRKTLRQGRQMK